VRVAIRDRNPLDEPRGTLVRMSVFVKTTDRYRRTPLRRAFSRTISRASWTTV